MFYFVCDLEVFKSQFTAIQSAGLGFNFYPTQLRSTFRVVDLLI